MPIIKAEKLEKLTYDLCRKSGSPVEEAELVSQRLVKANLTGHDSHGVARLELYMRRLKEGRLIPGSHIDILKENDVTAQITGNWGYGQVGATQAMDYAIKKARGHSLCAVGLREVNHIGRLADYVGTAADANMVALMVTNAGGFSKLMAPAGGKTRRLSTNPIAAAFPSRREFPVIIDMATSCVSEGKVAYWRDSGIAAPDKAILDKDGEPTVKAGDFYEGGAILPIGGEVAYKGFILNFMIEVLGGILTGAGYLKEDVERFSNGSLMIVIDLKVFRSLQDFTEELDFLIDYIKSSPKAADVTQIFCPGEKEALMEKERRMTGIDIPEPTWKELQSVYSEFGVAV
jgi:hydroxycarboxylate dehydrogenase B